MTNERTRDVDQLARLGQEMKDGTWVANARHRSKRRKSAWNLLLPLFALPLWAAIATSLVWLAQALHTMLDPGATHLFGKGPVHLNGLLVLLPCLIAAVCPALVVTNRLVYAIPPARRAMDAEDRSHPGTAYDAGQRALIKMGLWIFVVCAPLVLIGALLA